LGKVPVSDVLRVLVALETCDAPKYAERRRLVENTWAKRLPLCFNFEVFTGHRLGVPDDYSSLCRKTKAIAEYASRYEYDWLLKVDDDVFVRTDRLLLPLCNYAGLLLNDRKEKWCSGGFYWLNRRAMGIVARAPFNPDIASSAEDRWVSWALRQEGITPRQYDVAIKPCYCGYCVPEEEPIDWTAYIIDPQYSAKKFLEFEAMYG